MVISIFPIGGERLMNRTEADLQVGMRNAPQTGRQAQKIQIHTVKIQIHTVIKIRA